MRKGDPCTGAPSPRSGWAGAHRVNWWRSGSAVAVVTAVLATISAVGLPARSAAADSLTPAYITSTTGTPQSATIGTAFGTLAVTVTDPTGAPVSGASVTFTAPPPLDNSGNPEATGTFATDANCTALDNGQDCVATTGANGVATSSALTADTTHGSFVVSAGVAGSNPNETATFALANTSSDTGQLQPCDDPPADPTVGCYQVAQAQINGVPISIPSDCTYRTDITTNLINWINSLPQGTSGFPLEIQFVKNGCYRIDGTVYLRGLRHVIIDGNGAVIEQTSVANPELDNITSLPTVSPYCGSEGVDNGSADAATALEYAQLYQVGNVDIMWFIEGGCDLVFENMNITSTTSAHSATSVGPSASWDPSGSYGDLSVSRGLTSTTSSKQGVSPPTLQGTGRSGYTSTYNVVNLAYTVTNTGTITLFGVKVKDTIGSTKLTVRCPSTTLTPGASVACTGSYQVKTADLNFGSVSDATKVTGSTAQTGGTVITAKPSTFTIGETGAYDDLSVVTSSTTVGGTTSYRYLVTDTGDGYLSYVSVSDSLGTQISCPDTSKPTDHLAPWDGKSDATDSITCTGSDPAGNSPVTDTPTATATQSNRSQDSAFELAGAQRVLITGNTMTNVQGDCATPTGLDERGHLGQTNPQSYPSADVTVSNNQCTGAGRNGVSVVYANRVTVGGTVPAGSCTNTTTPPGGLAAIDTANCFTAIATNGIDVESDCGNPANGQGNILVNGNTFSGAQLVSAQTAGFLWNFGFTNNSVVEMRGFFEPETGPQGCGNAIPGQEFTVTGNTASAAAGWTKDADWYFLGESGGLLSLNSTPACILTCANQPDPPAQNSYTPYGNAFYFAETQADSSGQASGGLGVGGFEVGHNVLSGLDSTTVPIVGSSSSTGDTSCGNVSEYDTPPPGYGIEGNLNNGNPNQDGAMTSETVTPCIDQNGGPPDSPLQPEVSNVPGVPINQSDGASCGGCELRFAPRVQSPALVATHPTRSSSTKRQSVHKRIAGSDLARHAASESLTSSPPPEVKCTTVTGSVTSTPRCRR